MGLWLHLPAHGRGRGLAPELRQLLRQHPASWDLPELPELGGPLVADGWVAEAQHTTARALGASHCWFGVNGASGLLQAALLALARPGERVLLPRNLHRSLLHGCLLGGLRPVLFDLPFDPATGLWLQPDPAHLERVITAALAQGPIAALALVSPTYQGLAADLPALVALAHRLGLPVLVDQAHGYGEALAAQADLVVLSCQKSGGGLAQSAALLLQGQRLQVGAVERSLLWLQTSSPSALLLASAQASLGQLTSAFGQRQRRRGEARGLRLRQHLKQLELPQVSSPDPLRLVLHTAAMGINGLEADEWLMRRGVIAELPEPGTLTFCLGMRPPPGLRWRLGRQLVALRRALGGPPLPAFVPPPLPLVAEPEMDLGLAWRAPSEIVPLVPLAALAGRLAAAPVCPYPPGIPLLVPGERIDLARAEWLAQQQRLWPGQIADTVRVVAT
ncbi:aminotransferase class I/II-fold pyridoxal phosphate-dependent enzyme [Cyanobium sp. WAJ14-Wanaka]|uniref:aminotransferase class I/II-fold pyridoxal phosphate-dependent enzyme n=1 Tax=Cyanobium sp. WAJ14-Wanaka TaxID=2823725 RepID=UPI0020CFD70D|nr:aminotransferase class I/II-fold pyridoxal phosphate-dependent enzyme [Cyanobium sp. WAJ14-Wanaka]MCP9774233.1 DegT/DnrJ/EryC1/StrS family aminotransferase [Cyanobium sp. WAJ14-Wanaka]